MTSDHPCPPHIVPAGAAHADVLAALHDVCFQDQPWHRAWDAAEMLQVLALPGADGWLAVVPPTGDSGDPGGTPVGLMLVQRAGPEADILTLGVLPGPWRRRGVARALLRHAEAALARVGVDRLVLEVAAGNAPAITFYAHAGYDTVGRRAGYYARPMGVAEDALVMARAVNITS